MAWMLGAHKDHMVYLHRTPKEQGKVPYTMTPCSREEFEQLLALSEIVGRDEPMDIYSIRTILGPRALLGEIE